MNELLVSPRNPKIKHVAELIAKSSLRRSEGVFVVEGRREVERCAAAGFHIVSLFVCHDILSPGELKADADSVFEVSCQAYNKIAYREGTEGVVAVVKARSQKLEDLEFATGNPLIVVLESVEKPGNIGAVLRSADATGADAVIVCNPQTDIYNPNVLRASLGASYSVQTAVCTSEECIDFFRKRGIRILTAQLQDSSLYYDADMTGPVAVVFGTESTGLTVEWRIAADAHIRLPMLGAMDSLNVSVSAAVLLYEALRQRRSSK